VPVLQSVAPRCKAQLENAQETAKAEFTEDANL
jgi:hypothetical protein